MSLIPVSVPSGLAGKQLRAIGNDRRSEIRWRNDSDGKMLGAGALDATGVRVRIAAQSLDGSEQEAILEEVRAL